MKAFSFLYKHLYKLTAEEIKFFTLIFCSIFISGLMISESAWKDLQKALDAFKSSNIILPEYLEVLDKSCEQFEKEVQSNFLLIPEHDLRSLYLYQKYEYIEKRMEENKYKIDNAGYLSEEDTVKLKHIQERLYGVIMSFRSNMLYKNSLQSESWYWSMDTEIEKRIKHRKDGFKKINDKENPQTFDEIFYEGEFMCNHCIEVLRTVEPPLIDGNNNYIGGGKGAFCLWIFEMLRLGIVKHYSDRKVYANLLNGKINGLSIDDSMFGKPQPRAEKKYKAEFQNLLREIKLSHISQT